MPFLTWSCTGLIKCPFSSLLEKRPWAKTMPFVLSSILVLMYHRRKFRPVYAR